MDRARAGPGPDKVELDLLLKAPADQILPDRGEALLRRRGRNLHALHGVKEPLQLIGIEPLHLPGGFEPGNPDHLVRGLHADPGETPDKELLNGPGACIGKPLQRPELDPMRVGEDGFWARWDFACYPLKRRHLAVDIGRDPGVGVDDCSEAEVVEQPLLCGKGTLELDLEPRPVRPVPVDLLVADDLRLVGLGLDHQLEPVSLLPRPRPGDDQSRGAGGELGVQHRRRYPDTLLPPALPDLVEPGAVEEFPEDEGDVLRHNPRAVILDRYPVDLGIDLSHADKDIGEHLRLLAGVERVVHRFLDGGDDTARRRVKTKKVLVLLEELCNADTPLLFGEILSDRHAVLPQRWLPQGSSPAARRCAGS